MKYRFGIGTTEFPWLTYPLVQAAIDLHANYPVRERGSMKEMTITCDVCKKSEPLSKATERDWVSITTQKVRTEASDREYAPGPRPFDLCGACAHALKELLKIKSW